MDANTKAYDAAVHRASMIRDHERELRDNSFKMISDHSNKIESAILSKQNISDVVVSSYKNIYEHNKKSLIALAKDQITFAFQTIDASIGRIWRTKRPQQVVAENFVLDRSLVSDTTLLQGWSGVAEQERLRIDKIIRDGISNKLTLEEIAVAVRRGDVHNISYNQSKTLVTTAVTSVTNQADLAVLKANKQSLKGYQYIAILDSRTTRICASRSGRVFDLDDIEMLPPAHFGCRSFIVPVFKSWSDVASLENVAQVRKRNIAKLTKSQREYFDGRLPMEETYSQWLLRQPKDIQLKHIGDYKILESFIKCEVTFDKLLDNGRTISLNKLRRLTYPEPPTSTTKFAIAKEKLDALHLGISTPDDLINDITLQRNLRDYYLLQSSELDGQLSYTNYRGILLHNKRNSRNNVLNKPPLEHQLRFNPVTNRYEDIRMYQPNPEVFAKSMRLIDEASIKDSDKSFIKSFIENLSDKMSMNERSVVADNLRVLFSRYRNKAEVWGNFKAVSQAQLKFDIMNISESIENQLRKDIDPLKKLLEANYIDPVLGPVQLQKLHDDFISNIISRNNWEDYVAPKLAEKIRPLFDATIIKINPVIWGRLSERDLQEFYLRFIQRLSLADSPDIDSLAVSLGRDLYNQAKLAGDRNKWYEAGMMFLKDKSASDLYEIETFGVQKRRMRSRISGNYF